MWGCVNCRSLNEESVLDCWKCGFARPAPLAEVGLEEIAATPARRSMPRVGFRYFRGTLSRWEDLFAEAAEFASTVGQQRLINISHSEDHNEGVVTVWFWE